MLRTLLKYWLPVAIWAAVIVTASGPALSSAHTGTVLARVVVVIFGHPLPEAVFHYLHVGIRKLGHLSEYGILGALAFRATRGERQGFAMRWAVIAVIVCAAVASGDEWRQSFVPDRTSSPWDVLIDVGGATLAVLAIRASLLRSRIAR